MTHHASFSTIAVIASVVAVSPLGVVTSAVVLIVTAAAGGLALRSLTAHASKLRQLVVAITLAALVVGAVVAVLLGRLMVLDGDETRAAIGVLGATSIFAAVLAVVASAPLGRDAQRLEVAVRRLESGDRSARTGVVRADELGKVATALDELTARLDALETERTAIEQERSRMFASLGHDLRTPLSALRAAIEALADGVAPDPDRYLRSMGRDVEALGALIDDVFLLARIESGRLDLSSEPLDLSELADEAVEALTPAAAAKRVGLQLVSPGGVRVHGNQRALGRVIRNIVDNAIRHAPTGSTVEVVVTAAAASGARPSVLVIDHGPGFPPDYAGKAFEPFARPDKSRARATGGAGLGLVIARGLVEAHGGRLWIERNAHATPTGARVSFELPGAV